MEKKVKISKMAIFDGLEPPNFVKFLASECELATFPMLGNFLRLWNTN